MNYVEPGYHVPSATHIAEVTRRKFTMEKLLSKVNFKQRQRSLLLQQIFGPVGQMMHLPATSLPVDGIWLPVFWQQLHFLSTTRQTTLLRRYNR